MTIYEYGNPDADTVLIQLTGDHELSVLKNEVEEIRKRTSTDFRLIAAKVDDWNGIAGEKMAAQILRRLKFDNDTIRKVTRLVKWHDDRPDGTTKAVRRAVNRIGEELFPYYLEVQQADMLAQSDYRRAEKQERLDKVKEAYETIINEHQCVSLKTLAVTGKDLIEAGYKPGREIGETLNRLLEVVLADPQKNQKEILLGLLDEK